MEGQENSFHRVLIVSTMFLALGNHETALLLRHSLDANTQ